MSKSQIVIFGATKFRENSADSVTFHCDDHTAGLPSTQSFSRILPTPRKGNLGTVKALMNARKAFVINSGTATEKSVLGIIKVETSVPVGVSENEFRLYLTEVLKGYNTSQSENGGSDAGRNKSNTDMTVNGLLPDEFGDPTA